jgi:hypothetical protein
MFGENVKLTYKGKETFTTTFGSLLSLIILIMLLSFAGYKLFILVSRSNPDVSQQSFLKVLDKEPAYAPYQSTLGNGGFDFAFGIGKLIDPTVGYYQVNEVSFYYSKNETDPKDGSPKRIKKKRPLQIA